MKKKIKTYNNILKGNQMESKLKLLVKKIIKEEIQKLNEDTKINLTVQCVNPGIVQTTTGEAQSA